MSTASATRGAKTLNSNRLTDANTMSSSDDERDSEGNKWGCKYCSREFKSQGEMLFHENTWCILDHERKHNTLKCHVKNTILETKEQPKKP